MLTYDEQVAVSTRCADITGDDIQFVFPETYAEVVNDVLNAYDALKAQYDALVASTTTTGGN